MSVTLTWPADLDPPERSSWNENWMDPRAKRAGEAGAPRYGRRFSAVPKMVALSLICSRAQKGIFDRFLEQDTRFGTRLFWMPDPTTDGWGLLDEMSVPLLDEAGQRVIDAALWLCSFGDDMPTTSVVEQVKFRISFSVVVLPT